MLSQIPFLFPNSLGFLEPTIHSSSTTTTSLSDSNTKVIPVIDLTNDSPLPTLLSTDNKDTKTNNRNTLGDCTYGVSSMPFKEDRKRKSIQKILPLSKCSKLSCEDILPVRFS